MSGVLGKRNPDAQLERMVCRVTTQAPTIDTKPQCHLDFVLANVIGDERPYLSVNVFGKEFLGLLDSGASRTILGQRGYEQFKPFHLNLVPTGIKTCSVANGSPCAVVGTYNIPFCVQDVVKVVEVLIIPSLPHLLILGSDFWRKLGIVPDIRHGLWHFSQPIDTHIMSIADSDELAPEQRQCLDNVIKESFSDSSPGLGCTTLVEHKIVTKSDPIKQRHYPMSPALQRHVN